MRQHYAAGELRRAQLTADPFEQFDRWFVEAGECKAIVEPNAMTLATADETGRVMARTVLLKAWDHAGFVFFTNYMSQKADQIAKNPQVSLLFPWLALERQVAICGTVEKTSQDESHIYFSSRPRKSRIAASISPQSRPVASREVLESAFTRLNDQIVGDEVPLPDFWGGYRVVPQMIEFWQGRPDRLHDRFLYTKDVNNSWRIERLAP